MSRILMLGAFVVFVSAAFMRYQTEAEVKQIHKDVARLQRVLESERTQTNILRAELAHLEEPARLARLAQIYTDLQPAEAAQVVGLSVAVARLPLEASEAEADVPAEGGGGGQRPMAVASLKENALAAAEEGQ